MTDPQPQLAFTGLSVPKAGNRPRENEDAWYVGRNAHRVAVADGVSECMYARRWARLLARSFVNADSVHAVDSDWIRDPARLFRSMCPPEPRPWYLEAKLASGTHATFLGLEFATQPNGSIGWTAIAVGDCCVFHVHEDRAGSSFPVQSAEDFSDSPSSIASLEECIPPSFAVCSGTLVANSRLYCTTDALACWLLKEMDSGQDPWSDIERCLVSDSPRHAYRNWIDDLRGFAGLKDDDTTLVCIRRISSTRSCR